MAMASPGSHYIGSIVVGICYRVRHGSHRLQIIRPQILQSHLQHSNPQSSSRLPPLRRPTCRFLVRRAMHTAGGGNTCIGAHCYRLVFVVMAVACIIGFGLDVWLAIRTKRLYSKIYASKKSQRSMTV
ncbi:Protein NUCLEAR FUSION DEFECTIVE like [Actinidia chinensis var. chinensis]|uniref:Protein NUCLEAR FUSION DEFECTIVE like n=1 Tax=Actinidia chinensis var. chinensis TaxID=1590841 RepID=A0A2R6RBP7_ACTCC|nr:Protein NUCLEAR FUSION DEFECTIVE like [Actinidia chinensis var. chinensis]